MGQEGDEVTSAEGVREGLSLLQAAAPPDPVRLEQPERIPSARARTRKIRVLVVDDHEVMRQGLAGLLTAEPDIEIVGEAVDGKVAVELTQQLGPDVLLMDISMPVMNGIEATRLIHARYPTVCVIGLSMFEEVEMAQAMWDAGAVAYLIKSGAADALVETIRTSVARA